MEELTDVGTLPELLRRRAASYPDGLVFRYLDNGETEGGALTFGQLQAEAAAFAVRISEENGPGSRALIMCPPGLEYIIAIFGCLQAGVVPVPVYPPSTLLPGRDIVRLMAVAGDVGARTAITVPRLERLTMPGEMGELNVDWTFVERSAGAQAQGGPVPPQVEGAGPDDVALVQYTSGSTGAPRGVVLTHRQVLSQLSLIRQAYGAEWGSGGISWLPPYHDMGLIGAIFTPVWLGGHCTIMAPNAFLRRPLRWLEAISRFRAQFSPAPNFAYEQCVRRSTPAEREGLDLSSWAIAINGAEPVRAATLQRFYEAFAPYGLRREALWPSYGMAETTLLISAGSLGRTSRTLRVDRGSLAVGRLEETPPGGPGGDIAEVVTCGPPASGTSVLAVDPETRAPVEEGAIGELWVSGPHVASGYWGRPEESAERFQAELKEGQGGHYLRTGDLGAIVGGEVVVTGRIKDLVIIRGANYYPHDLEDTMQSAHPALREDFAIAFSVPGEETEQLVLVQGADIKADDGATLKEAADRIVKAVADQHGLRPDVLALVSPKHVPRTSSGKVRRGTARDLFVSGRLPCLYQWRAAGGGATT